MPQRHSSTKAGPCRNLPYLRCLLGTAIERTFPAQRFAPEILSISSASARTFPGEPHPSSTLFWCPSGVTVISTSGQR
jgi:hypothetical protein